MIQYHSSGWCKSSGVSVQPDLIYETLQGAGTSTMTPNIILCYKLIWNKALLRWLRQPRSLVVCL